LLADNPLLRRDREYPGAFKLSITHGLLVAFAAYAFALYARAQTDKFRRWCLVALALIAAHNVVFVVFGRTGYLVIAALFVYFFVVTFGRRGLLLITFIATATFVAAYTTSSTFQQRIDVSVQQFQNWQPGKPSDTSVGSRLEWYSNSLKIVAGRPLFGAGTGSFAEAYAAAVRGTPMSETTNPHNEYLLIAIQIGLVGLACLIYLFYAEWRLAARLAPLYRDLARGLVLMMVIGCMFNSLLLDHTEGLWFAWASGLLFAGLKPHAGMEEVPQ
jgi:O-antigen ligase